MSSSDEGIVRVQSVRTAWTNRMRDEALRMGRPEVSKIVHVGWVVATYADADGSNAFPSAATIAAITGSTKETVARALKVLSAMGLIQRKRRPNQSTTYQLLVPMQRLDWAPHLHLYTDTRQARRKRAEKEKEVAALLDAQQAAAKDGSDRTALQNGVRTPFPAGVPDSVPAGVSEPAEQRSRTVADSVAERYPDSVPAGGGQSLPTSGRDPHPDHDMAEPGPPPPVGAGAGARGQDDSSPVEQRLDDIARRIAAEAGTPPPQLQSLPGGATPRASENGQRALLLSVSDDPAAPGPAARGVSEAERAQLRAAGDADITRVIAAIDELGEPAALALYSGRLVTRAHNSRALAATRTHTGT